MPSTRGPLGLLSHGLLLVVGALAGGLGSFVHSLRLAGLPAGLACALALTAAVLAAGGLLAGARSGAGAAAAGWVLPVLVLSSPRPEGDLVVSGSRLGYAWLVGGMLVAGAALAVPWASVTPKPADEPPAPSGPPGPRR